MYSLLSGSGFYARKQQEGLKLQLGGYVGVPGRGEDRGAAVEEIQDVPWPYS